MNEWKANTTAAAGLVWAGLPAEEEGEGEVLCRWVAEGARGEEGLHSHTGENQPPMSEFES